MNQSALRECLSVDNAMEWLLGNSVITHAWIAALITSYGRLPSLMMSTLSFRKVAEVLRSLRPTW
ncbi:unnamed protein product [Onchocerca flexuosa]|uniref:Uncharacterized protein n=1 Tax=Onchocerca flexuosa TaxID=387005 RepID=A0A183H815_9BILA|nr:unnamed protein product [Onchocerca flexuosa]